jgi:hypothetical protein
MWITISGPPARRPRRTVCRKSSALVRRLLADSTSWQAASDSEAVAALATSCRQDGAASAGAHAQAEPVHLVTTTVVRLVSTLAHRILHALLLGMLVSGSAVGRVHRVARRRTSPDGWANPSAQLAPPARATDPPGPGRGHAAPVEPVSTCQRYVCGARRVNSTGALEDRQELKRRHLAPLG